MKKKIYNLQITLGIKNQVVEKYFENQIVKLLRLISDFYLPYEYFSPQ